MWGTIMRVRFATIAATLALGACASASQPTTQAANDIAAFQHAPLSADALMAHVRVLSSDEFEGRAPGTNGERLTIEYLERAYAATGLQPGVTLPNGQRS